MSTSDPQPYTPKEWIIYYTEKVEFKRRRLEMLKIQTQNTIKEMTDMMNRIEALKQSEEKIALSATTEFILDQLRSDVPRTTVNDCEIIHQEFGGVVYAQTIQFQYEGKNVTLYIREDDAV